ncbi:hypothetical protein [Azospirillum sp.]|uniref:hypothetical protein n=1 Tax=Azospirillum sp. TaxID=34012 RepID=UPI003D702DA9
MKCPHCQANLAHVNGKGEPMVRNHGLVFQANGGVALVCPKCKGDVDMSRDLAKALQSRMILVFK